MESKDGGSIAQKQVKKVRANQITDITIELSANDVSSIENFVHFSDGALEEIQSQSHSHDNNQDKTISRV